MQAAAVALVIEYPHNIGGGVEVEPGGALLEW